MKSYNGLTARYLKSHKKRTLLTIAGIILSVSLLCAAGIMGESLKFTLLEDIRQSYGSHHVSFSDLDRTQIQKLQNNIKIEKVGTRLDAGLTSFSEGMNVLISSYNSDCLEIAHLKLAMGTLPKEGNDIVLEQWVVENMKDKPAVGDSMELEFVTKEGFMAADRNMALAKKEKKVFRLVGILENGARSQFEGFSCALITEATAINMLRSGSDGEKSNGEDRNEIRWMAGVQFKEGLPLQETIQEAARSIGAKQNQIHPNTAVLTAEGQSGSNASNTAVFVIQWTAILIIIIATVAVIYNAFHISVIERIHQFGLLRSVGSTPRQIRDIVLGEALLVSAIGIPLGILCGIGAVKAVIAIFRTMSAGFFGHMQVQVPVHIVALTAVLGILTVVLSALGPAVSAGRVSPLDAILNRSRTGKGKKRRRKHYILGKVFRVEGIMAYENLKRNKKRFFVTVFSMCIGIALFIFFSTFMDMMNDELNRYFREDLAVSGPFDPRSAGFTEQNYEEITRIEGVKTVYRLLQKEMTPWIPDEQVGEKFRNATEGQQGYSLVLEGKRYYTPPSSFYGYRELELDLCRRNVIQGAVDEKRMSAENGVLIYQDMELPDVGTVAVSYLKVGDEILVADPLVPQEQAKPVKLKVMGILDRIPLAYNGGGDRFGMITTEQVFKKITGRDTFTRFDIELERGADVAAVKNALQTIAAKVDKSRVLDFTNSDAGTWSLQMSIILFGLVAVISLIGSLNIINTISTNLILRIREFGTLRAVGMTPGQLRKMVNLEGVFYGLIASFYGGIAGCILARIEYESFNQIQSLTWHFPWQAVLGAGVVATLVGLASSIVPLKRITRMNVVDAVRMEE